MELENSLFTGEVIALRYGIQANVPELGNWPEGGEKFIEAEEAEDLAKQIIRIFREDLKNVRIGYTFKRKASKNGDSVVLGQAKTENDVSKVFSRKDAYIVLGFDVWQTLDLDGKCRLLHHELEHIGVDGETGAIKMVNHAVEEFPATVKIFGLGQTSHVDFVHAYQEFQKNMGKA